jgi:surfeit locus 1 family protein
MTSAIPHSPPAGARFRPGALLTLLAALGLAVLLALGTWQMQRLAWKEGLIALREARLAAAPIALATAVPDPAVLDYRPARARGAFLHDRAQLMGVSTQGGVLGHRLLVPLRLESGAVLLVDRGWVPAGWQGGPAAASAPEPEGTVEAQGVLRDRSHARAGPFTPANDPARRLWYWYDLGALRSATGLDLLPLVLDLQAADAAGPPFAGGTLAPLPNDHLGYALTWYGLALGLIGVWVAFGIHRGRSPS